MNAVDTNVLLYVYDDRDSRKTDIAGSLVDSLDDSVLLWQVACEFIASSRKLVSAGFTLEDAWENLWEIRRLFPLVLPSGDVLIRARRMSHGRQIHIWDALIYSACLEAGVTRLYSEDVPGAQIAGLEIVNPFL